MLNHKKGKNEGLFFILDGYLLVATVEVTPMIVYKHYHVNIVDDKYRKEVAAYVEKNFTNERFYMN